MGAISPPPPPVGGEEVLRSDEFVLGGRGVVSKF